MMYVTDAKTGCQTAFRTKDAAERYLQGIWEDGVGMGAPWERKTDGKEIFHKAGRLLFYITDTELS